jgi:hypothetical protein
VSSEPFTPGAESIETAWVIMCQQSRISTQPPESELIAEFTRFVNSIKADAWDEGFNVSENKVMDTPNPYREDA